MGRKIDMIGKRFGKLTVIKECDEKTTNKKICYVCKCDCRNETVVQNSLLLDGRTSSCGCVSSISNMKIAELLKEWKIHALSEYKFDDCKNIFPLPFDFYLPDLNMCIEYDGEFHYLESTHNGKEKLLLQQKRDKIKTNYCKRKNIKLLRIPYWEKENIEEILKKEIFTDRERLSEKATLCKYLNKYLCNYMWG